MSKGQKPLCLIPLRGVPFFNFLQNGRSVTSHDVRRPNNCKSATDVDSGDCGLLVYNDTVRKAAGEGAGEGADGRRRRCWWRWLLAA